MPRNGALPKFMSSFRHFFGTKNRAPAGQIYARSSAEYHWNLEETMLFGLFKV